MFLFCFFGGSFFCRFVYLGLGRLEEVCSGWRSFVEAGEVYKNQILVKAIMETEKELIYKMLSFAGLSFFGNPEHQMLPNVVQTWYRFL
jgi:hypothetical protein